MTLMDRMTRPRYPKAAFMLDATEVAAVELRSRGGRFDLAAAARTPLAPGLLTPSFDGRNIALRDELATAIDETVRAAGLGRRQRWSVLLPEAALKSLVLTFDGIPGSREELREMVDWKVERMVGLPASELRITRQFISAGETPRFLVVVAKRSVLEEYDALISTLDWKVGLVVPRYVGEAAWFDWDPTPGDKLVVGARGATCVAAVIRAGELVLVRSVDGDPGRLHDELYRFALFYRDRIAESPNATVASLLVYGSVDEDKVAAAVADALGLQPSVYNPIPGRLQTGTDGEIAPALLAAAGLATQAWAH